MNFYTSSRVQRSIWRIENVLRGSEFFLMWKSTKRSSLFLLKTGRLLVPDDGLHTHIVPISFNFHEHSHARHDQFVYKVVCLIYQTIQHH